MSKGGDGNGELEMNKKPPRGLWPTLKQAGVNWSEGELESKMAIAAMSMLLVILMWGTTAQAMSNYDLSQPFIAKCECVAANTFRFDTHEGEDAPYRRWTIEKLGPEWEFRWQPPDRLTLDGKRIVVVGTWDDGKVLLAVQKYPSSVWSYAINIGLENIAGSMVHGTSSGSLGSAIKARAIEFKCDFKFRRGRGWK